jgi:hypothetical protein
MSRGVWTLVRTETARAESAQLAAAGKSGAAGAASLFSPLPQNHPVHPNAPHLQSVSVHAPSAIAPQSVHEKLRNSASCPQISAQFGVLSSLNHYN